MVKKLVGMLAVAGLVVSLSGSLYAGCNQGTGGDCGNCLKPATMTDPMKKFQADTIDLRQEMMMKRFELQRENLKPVQNENKVKLLQSEIKSLQVRIQDIRQKSGLPTDKCDGECDFGTRRGDCKKAGDCKATVGNRKE
ncbi:MAG TPA: hypothetical protein HPP76_05600 [Desulfuromonadales bacterium]|nr:hypothetical protein [Desulfuromonadales bacterium]